MSCFPSFPPNPGNLKPKYRNVYQFIIGEYAQLCGNDLKFQEQCQKLCELGVKPEDIVKAWNRSHDHFRDKMYLVIRMEAETCKKSHCA